VTSSLQILLEILNIMPPKDNKKRSLNAKLLATIDDWIVSKDAAFEQLQLRMTAIQEMTMDLLMCLLFVDASPLYVS